MGTAYIERPLGDTIADPATESFWRATQAGIFNIKRCTACRQAHWYPRALCPFCLGDTVWEAASGLGTIYSVSVTRRAGPIAYAIAYVTLDEGVTMLTNIVDCDLDALRIGQRVKLCFKASANGSQVPMFTPAG